MIEDDLRSLLASRSDEVVDSPARVAQVHSRIGVIRRRRAVGTALALVLIVAGGVLFTRLPGKPVTLPAGVPAGPYFDDGGDSQLVRGYHGESYSAVPAGAVMPSVYPELRVVVVARCDRPGDLILRTEPGHGKPLEQRLRCRVAVGNHFEGAVPLDPELNDAGLIEVVPAGPSSGAWRVGQLIPLYLDSISRAQLTHGLIGGLGHPGGGSFRLVIPGTLPEAHGLGIEVGCVRHVRLEFRVSGRLLATVTCDDDAKWMDTSFISTLVPEQVVTGLGLRPLQAVTVDVRSTGRQTDQWVVVAIG